MLKSPYLSIDDDGIGSHLHYPCYPILPDKLLFVGLSDFLPAKQLMTDFSSQVHRFTAKELRNIYASPFLRSKSAKFFKCLVSIHNITIHIMHPHGIAGTLEQVSIILLSQLKLCFH
ncbi:hypothetical protein ES703_90625 [subsurface metagenome]